jgi:hypothetical protein
MTHQLTIQEVFKRIETAIATVEQAEEAEQAAITHLVNQGYSRDEATRIIYSKGAEYSEKDIREAQQTFKSKPFQLLR